MANVNGIFGYNKSSSTANKLLVAYQNDIQEVIGNTFYGLALNPANNVEFEAFLDRVFMQNYDARPISFNGSAWSTEYLARTMISKYIKGYKAKSRLLLGNCKFANPQAPLDKDGNAITFPSRVFMSDLFVGNNLTWGMEWGQNGSTIAGTNIFQLDQSAAPLVQNFQTSNIKVGDPLFITSGNSQLITKPYFVSLVESPYRLRLTETINVTATNLHFYVGSNWFDVATDDNDQITGFIETSDRYVIFKLLSLWYYTGSQLKRVKDAVGTSSQRSVINSKGYTYYFHGSDPKITGIYRYDGVQAVKVSRAIDPFIQGMSSSNYSSVVSWQEGDELRFYLGDITNANYGISISKAVASYHTVTGAWDVGPIADSPTCATTYRSNNQQDTYIGTTTSSVMKMATGYDHNTTPIRFRFETKPYYLSGTDVINEVTRIQIIGKNVKGIKVKFKMWNTPDKVDDEYQPLGELRNDRTELILKKNTNYGSGVQLLFEEYGILENDFQIEKATFFFLPERRRDI